ncbi:unnamed protein product [Eruca vesicaria subsp. sativa]|uniref:Serpin domain-containing protein n=1 Tax=Eruca vesicaria subsp. sativa TaxID=29727 RepID=A0ABC8IYX8_ERUVS|nr:unnamed protein product [Eruca vesicaria subsp. sativa]
MDPKKRKQKLITSSETADPSISKMERKKKKKQKLSNSRPLTRPSLSQEELREAMKKLNDAALVLTSKVIDAEARNSNFVFSPASISAALTMMAVTNGTHSDELNAVYSEIATVVFADDSASGGPKISAVNGVWIEQSLPVDHSSKDILENVFKATFAQVDFRFKAEDVRIEMNKWASDHTNGLIRDILPPGFVTSESVKVCGNALYFKGAWEKKFDKSLTKHKMFHLLVGKPVRVPFMSSHKDQYIEAYNGFKVLGLPYRQGRNDDTNRKFSMYFYLPDKKDGLNNLLEEMTSTPGFLDSHIPKFRVAVGDFRIPKFNFCFMFEASRFFEGDVLLQLYHKACVEIDEDGAEAAAVTYVGQKVSLCRNRKPTPPKRIDFVAEHPFLFMIREDKTGTVLFAGQIFDPRAR